MSHMTEAKEISITQTQTAWGSTWIASCDSRLVASNLPVTTKAEIIAQLRAIYGPQVKISEFQEPVLIQAGEWLVTFTRGIDPGPPPPLEPRGTPFQIAVWKTMLGLGWGKTVSYRELATLSGNPRAVRAVGGVCKRNPLAPFIPCHRVVAAGSKLGGFFGGTEYKRKLLANEGIVL